MRNLLKITFAADALIAIAFGIYSWFFPLETFGTMLILPETELSAFPAILASLSLCYVLIGLIGVIGLKATYPLNCWIGFLLLFRHLSEGIMKVSDIGEDWLIGNPYPDIATHTFFSVVYILAIGISIRQRKSLRG